MSICQVLSSYVCRILIFKTVTVPFIAPFISYKNIYPRNINRLFLPILLPYVSTHVVIKSQEVWGGAFIGYTLNHHNNNNCASAEWLSYTLSCTIINVCWRCTSVIYASFNPPLYWHILRSPLVMESDVWLWLKAVTPAPADVSPGSNDKVTRII